MKLPKIITPGERISKKLKGRYVEIVLNENKTSWVAASQNTIDIENVIMYEPGRIYVGKSWSRYNKNINQIKNKTKIQSQVSGLEIAVKDFKRLNIDCILMIVLSCEGFETMTEWPYAPHNTGYEAKSSIQATPIILRK